MGLLEKRMPAPLRDEASPEYRTEPREIAGRPIVYDVAWNSFADNTSAMENLEFKAPRPPGEFREITGDQFAKAAASLNIHGVRLAQGEDAAVSAFTLLGGTLNMPRDWNGWAGSFSPNAMREKIEPML